MNTFALLFLAFLAISTLVEYWLSFRQSRHISKHKMHVPDAFSKKISLAEHQKAADYSITKLAFGRIEGLVGIVLLLIWTLGGGINWLDQWWRTFNFNDLFSGTLLILSVVIISSMFSLPASVFRTFVIEEKFGFNKSTAKIFIADQLKGLLLALVIGVPLILLVLWLMQSAGQWWWVYAWIVLTSFSLLMSWAFPKFIAPLFNKFEPLEEGEVASRILSLLDRSGFTSDGVFVMDGSRRSGHGNAYFTGLGKNKRIVFFDTLLKQLTPSQIEAVLAHELGHFKHKHIFKGMLVSTLMTFVGFAVLAWLMQQSWFYSAFHIEQSSNYMALILFVLVSPAFTFFIGPAMAWFSRKHEFEADTFAAEQSSADELIAALVSMYRENASTLTPDPLHSAFHDSHPPASIRIGHLEQIGT